jgi:hypothetical protein
MGQTAPDRDPWQNATDQYKSDGYLIAKGLLPRAQVLQVQADMRQLVQQQLRLRKLTPSADSGPLAWHGDLQALFHADRSAYIATLTLCAKLTSLWDLYLDRRVRELVSALGIAFPVFQTTPVLHLMSHALKIPNGYHGIGVHQDWPTLQGSLDTITLWIPFVDVDRNLFPLEVIPASHRRGLYPFTRTDHIFEVTQESYDSNNFVPLEARCGDVVFMSSFTLHRSGTQGDDRLRVATSFRYENAAEREFIARGYPFAQKRSVIPALITSAFPTPEQVCAQYR